MAQPEAPCRGCGGPVARVGSRGRIRLYCSDECKPRCAVEGCGQPVRKRDWCASHYAQWQRLGEVKPFGYKWADPEPCKVCGAPPAPGIRTFCSTACAFLWRKYDGAVPSVAECVGCGVEIDLTKRGKGGQRIKAHVKFCRRCRQDYDKYKMTAAQLAERDGANCGICGEPVDMTLSRKDAEGIMCASVDHILPRALGGTHDAANLQLAHLYCNMRKSDRVVVEAGVEGGGVRDD